MTGGMIFVFMVVIVAISLLGRSGDKERVRVYFAERGEELLDITRKRFGPGWRGEKDSRIYQVRYRDKLGNIHQAFCKTSIFSGVYLSEDYVVENLQSYVARETNATLEPARAAADTAQLEQELQRLREENARLRQQLEQASRGPRPLFADSEAPLSRD